MLFITTFEIEFDLFCSEHHTIITEQVQKISGCSDELSDLFYTQIEELKGYVAAGAANDCLDLESTQEEAIAESEEWITSNIDSSDTFTCVAILLWLNGIENGISLIDQELGLNTYVFGM